MKFIPMIFETFGAMHENSERFHHYLVARASAYRDVRSSTLHTYWNRRISYTLQTINPQITLVRLDVWKIWRWGGHVMVVRMLFASVIMIPLSIMFKRCLIEMIDDNMLN